MTQHKPTLRVDRLVVLKGQHRAADLSFHAGVNVIAGENSSGKTTLIRFLAYGLGGEQLSFNQTASSCDTTLVQLSANGSPLTLRREVSTRQQQPIAIFWGPMDKALVAGIEQWELYPFRRSDSKLSFSQVVFRTLEIPEFRGERDSNITLHQIFRLIYSDQESSSGDLFRFEKFDSAITRQAIGDFLLGVDDNKIYDLRLVEADTDKRLGTVIAELKAVYQALGRSGTDLSVEFFEQQVASIKHELSAVEQSIASLKSATEAQVSNKTATKEDAELRQRLSHLHLQVSHRKDQQSRLQAEIADSQLFVAELRSRLEAATEASSAAKYLGSVDFAYCPSCMSPVSSDSRRGYCALCKSAVSRDAANSQLLRMRNELSLQIKESEALLEGRRDEVAFLEREIPDLTRQLEQLQRRFAESKQQWRTPLEIDLENALRRAGQLEQELINKSELRKLVVLLQQKAEERNSLNAELSRVREEIARLVELRDSRRQDAYNAVAGMLKRILRSDLPRQSEFLSAEQIEFDFGANRLYVDSHQEFSASSMVYLRHSFHLALLAASCIKPYFRFPRLVILDGIEDGGMEPERSFNFQAEILRLSESMPVDHQIILTTSNIAPLLDTENFVIGKKHTHSKKSLYDRPT